MTPKTLKALKGSIAKWKRVVFKNGPDKGSENCPLCTLFLKDGLNMPPCRGCPVREKTGFIECIGSPYNEWSRHHYREHDDLFPNRVKGCKTCHKHAKAELKFLEGLLP